VQVHKRTFVPACYGLQLPFAGHNSVIGHAAKVSNIPLIGISSTTGR
jgi:hypothetical protein